MDALSLEVFKQRLDRHLPQQILHFRLDYPCDPC